VIANLKFSSDYSPVFIVGSPRTGSTILFEKLTNELDILYPNNLSWKFYKNFFFSFLLSKKLYKNKAHNCFDSDHGGTLGCGWNAPSECGTFWRKWIDIDTKNFYDANDLSNKQKEEIKKDILNVINYFNKPILFKNLVTGQMMRLLLDIFPDAKFIFVKRDMLLTAQSILKAKRKNAMKDNQYWSIKPKNYQELKQVKNPYEQIIKQIYYIEKQIIEDSKLVKKDNFLLVNYENLKEDLVKAKEFIGVENRNDYKNHEIYISNKISLKDEEIKKFKSEIDKLGIL
jgi:LPS sulfotransferase NodH